MVHGARTIAAAAGLVEGVESRLGGLGEVWEWRAGRVAGYI